MALILTPLQTSAEEFFFRAYVLQGLGLITRHPFLLILLSSLLFAVPHFGNPEMQRSALWLGLSYLAIGAFLTLITLKDNRLELALGVHAANNLFVALFVNTKDSALPAPSLFILKDVGDPRLSFSLFLLSAAIYYFLFFGKRPSPSPSRP
ncbi:MAG: CPBP family intramembrane metalloprotease [Leptolyngbyaceae cyanobacterium SL_7_1]|nr:CPBP family intramembrane metalloprotease [Leptolyngbyaceae cyanobacterium SL_7_1]